MPSRLLHLSIFIIASSFLMSLLSCFLCQNGFCKSVQKRILQSVKEYKVIKPSVRTIKSIHKYNKYIKYFCSFNYHRARYNVNPNYIRALICTESAGNHRAVSKDKALGLTQILFETGQRWARELAATNFDFKYINEKDLHNLKPRDLFNPPINILLACYGTDKFNALFGGKDFVSIAASWNAGHKRVIKHKGCPPYRETIRFLGKLNGYMLYFMKNGYPSSLKIQNFPRRKFTKQKIILNHN